MMIFNSCRGKSLEIVQRSEASNDAWRDLESHYRARGSRKIIRLLPEINGKEMESGGDPYNSMMEIDRLVANLHILGDKSMNELRKCIIVVVGLSADYEMECRTFENKSTGLEN